MADTVKPEEVLQDIRSGMSEGALKEKYGFTDTDFKSLLKQLVQAALDESPKLAGKRPAPPRGRRESFTCPACGARVDAQFDECPKCGIIASKANLRGSDLPHLGLRTPLELDSPRHAFPVPPEAEEPAGGVWSAIQGFRYKKTAIALVVLVVVGLAIHEFVKRREVAQLKQAAQELEGTLSARTPEELQRSLARLNGFVQQCAEVVASRFQDYDNRMWAYDKGKEVLTGFQDLLDREARPLYDGTPVVHGDMVPTRMAPLWHRLKFGVLMIPDLDQRQKLELRLIYRGETPLQTR